LKERKAFFKERVKEMVYKSFFSTFYVVKKAYLEKKEDYYQLKALDKLKANEI